VTGYQSNVDIDTRLWSYNANKKKQIVDNKSKTNNSVQVADQFFYVKSIPIKQSHLNSLLQPERLYDSKIESYLNCITFDGVFVMNCFTANSIFHEGKINNLTKESFSNINMIVAPLLINEHCKIVLLNVPSQIFLHLDPLGNAESNSLRYLNNWQKFSSTKSNLNKQWLNLVMGHSKQNDSFNCDVLICKFAEIFLNSEFNFLFDNSYND
jgi:hypothetical protein